MLINRIHFENIPLIIKTLNNLKVKKKSLPFFRKASILSRNGCWWSSSEELNTFSTLASQPFFIKINKPIIRLKKMYIYLNI